MPRLMPAVEFLIAHALHLTAAEGLANDRPRERCQERDVDCADHRKPSPEGATLRSMMPVAELLIVHALRLATDSELMERPLPLPKAGKSGRPGIQGQAS